MPLLKVRNAGDQGRLWYLNLAHITALHPGSTGGAVVDLVDEAVPDLPTRAPARAR